MKSDFSDIELAYSTKEMAEKVGIAKPTVRKYAQLLEEYHYEFIKNGDRRVFVEADIEAMLEMKKSDTIERTAKELAEKQKERIKSDIENAIYTVSPSDITPSNKEKSLKIVLLEKRYDQLLSAFQNMTIDYAATKEQMNIIEANTSQMVSSIGELTRKYEEEQKEKQLIKEKLDIAIEYIQKQEKQKIEKKSIWKRLFN